MKPQPPGPPRLCTSGRIHLQCGGLCHVLLVAGDALHHPERANPVRGHEHVLFETIGSLVCERIHGVWRNVCFFKSS